MKIILLALSAALLGLSGVASGQPLPVQESGRVQFVTGGVGEDERAAFDEARKAFNLEVIFAVKGGGNYLSDVDVAVLDASKNEVLRTTSQGPRLLARVPPGRYTVQATYDGNTQTRTVAVPATGTKGLALYWSDPAVAEGSRIESERPSRGASRTPER